MPPTTKTYQMDQQRKEDKHMPVVNKQSPRGNSVVKHSVMAGSVLSEAVPVGELEDDFIKMVIYGQNRTGKTTLACQFPKPLLLVSFEPTASGGAKSVKKMDGVTLLRLQSTEKAVRLARELATSNPFKTVVIDSATSYQDVVLADIMNLSKLPEQLDWGIVSRDQYRDRASKTKEALRPFLDLKCHVVITAKERDHNPQDKDKPEITRKFQMESFLAADLGGQTVGWLHDACDYIGRLYLDKEVIIEHHTTKLHGKDITTTTSTETGRIVRRLRTLYHPNIAAGFRTEHANVPEYIEDPSFAKLQAIINGEEL